MAPAPQRAVTAMNAMKAIGFPGNIAKSVLKNLLKVYDNNWEYIEAENYRVLADAILDTQESTDVGDKKKDAVVSDEPEPLRKRHRANQEDQVTSPSMCVPDGPGESSLKMPKLEPDFSPKIPFQQRRVSRASTQMNLRSKIAEPVLPEPSFIAKAVLSPPSLREKTTGAISLQPSLREKTARDISLQPSLKEKTTGNISPQSSLRERTTGHISPQPSRSCERAGPISTQMNCRVTRSLALAQQTSPLQGNTESGSLQTYRRDKRPVLERSGNLICYKEPKIEPGTEVLPKNVMANCSTAPFRPKDEPADDGFPKFEVPIAVIRPPHPIPAGNQAHQYQASQDDSLIRSGFIRQTNASETQAAQHADKGNKKVSNPDAACKNADTSELVSVQEASVANIDIASSTMGEVKLSFACCLDRPDFRMPSLDTVFKMVEDRCLKSYKILQPDFLVMNLMKEMCQCVLELGSESADDRQGNIVKVTPLLESLKRPGVHSMFDGMLASSLNSSLKLVAPEGSGPVTMNGLHANQEVHGNKGNGRGEKKKEFKPPEDSNIASHSLVMVQQPQFALVEVRPIHDTTDISKGEERVRISLVNEVSNEKFPSSFQYIPQNIVYQNAYVNFSLARIGDEDCCSDCFGDCLAASIPCACARETGGEFAYTSDGLIRKEFLDECISMNRNPQKHRHIYCKDCPLERSKNEVTPDPCKGHLVRKFIKECWSKCGCNKQCGNRVVQRGITSNLQVFFTAEEKEWGLRTLDELPRGAFVCEYVGEVLTNMELYYRTVQTTGNDKHTYPVLLDADWGSEGVLKDEESLCLDATFYGNVARFVNHRCFDANLVEVPVEVETPDHHYYHLAFFTTRKIEAFEELTWDYGIDFDDHAHPIKAFRCRCGSKLCRDIKRSNMDPDRAALAKLMRKRKPPTSDRPAAVGLPIPAAKKPAKEKGKAREQSVPSSRESLIIWIPSDRSQSTEVALDVSAPPAAVVDDIFAPAWGIRLSDGLIGNTRHSYDFVKHAVPPVDASIAQSHDTPSLVRLICDSLTSLTCYASAGMERLEVVGKELSHVKERYEKLREVRAIERDEHRLSRRELDNARLALQKSFVEDKRLRDEVARLELELLEAVPKFKASQAYKDELNQYGVGSFTEGYELCKDEIGRAYPGFDLAMFPGSPDDDGEGSGEGGNDEAVGEGGDGQGTGGDGATGAS